MDIKPFFALFSCALLATTITACGKGGSGNNARKTANTEKITLFPNSIEYQQTLREQGVQYDFVADVGEGIDASNLHIVADMDDNVFSSFTHSSTDGTIAHLTLSTFGNLWGGKYSGTVNIHLCKDENCNNELAGSPVFLPYNITFAPSQFRLEPVLTEENGAHRAVVDYGKDYMAVYAESEEPGTPSATLRIETEIAEELGELVLPQKLLEDFQVSNISSDGFTIATPSFDDHSYTKKRVHKFEYELSFTNSTTVVPYTIYSIEEGWSGATDQVVFLENPIEFEAPYFSAFSFVVPFIFVGENSSDLADITFNMSVNPTPGLDAQSYSSTRHRNYIDYRMQAPFSPFNGRYSGQVEASIDGEVISSIEIGGDVVDIPVTEEQPNNSAGSNGIEAP